MNLIIGAGPVGLVTALFLKKLQKPIRIIEKKSYSDWIYHDPLRVIGLTLSMRGISVLKELGIDLLATKEVQPIVGRTLHSLKGQRRTVDYDATGTPVLYSLSRERLLHLLYEHYRTSSNPKIEFSTRLLDLDPKRNIANLWKENDKHALFPYQTIHACDGVHSSVVDILQCKDFLHTDTTPLSWKYYSVSVQAHPVAILNRIHIYSGEFFFIVGIPTADHKLNLTIAHKQDLSPSQKTEFIEKVDQWARCCNLFQSPERVAGILTQEIAQNRANIFYDRQTHLIRFNSNVFLHGDARGSMIHLMGQGLNTSLVDLRNSLLKSDPFVLSDFAFMKNQSRKQIHLFASQKAMNRAVRELQLSHRLSQKFPLIFTPKYSSLVNLTHHHPLARIRRRFEETALKAILFFENTITHSHSREMRSNRVK